jgi:hypothetical protein
MSSFNATPRACVSLEEMLPIPSSFRATMSSFNAPPSACVSSNARFNRGEMPPIPSSFRATVCEAFPNRREATLAEREANVAEREANVAEREADLAEREAAFGLRLAAFAEREAIQAEREAELQKNTTQFDQKCEDEIDRQKHWIMSCEAEQDLRMMSLDSYGRELQLRETKIQEKEDRALAMEIAYR